METGNKAEINNHLKLFKEQSGCPDYKSLLSISVRERLPALYESNPQKIHALIVVALTMAFETMNLARPMNESQILELAETIIESSNEDYLSLEDVMLFLQGLTRGKYGALYESMDIPKFMEKFEIYRLERHKQYYGIMDEKHANYKAMGDPTRSSENQDRERDLQRGAMADYLREMYKGE